MPNPTSLVEDCSFVCSADPALDSGLEGFSEKYQRWIESGDAAALDELTKPGGKPVTYTLRHPRGRLRRMLRDAMVSAGPDGAWHAIMADLCAYCLVDVEGFILPNGQELAITRENDRRARAKRATDDVIDALDDEDESIVNEIAARVIAMMTPSPS